MSLVRQNPNQKFIARPTKQPKHGASGRSRVRRGGGRRARLSRPGQPERAVAIASEVRHFPRHTRCLSSAPIGRARASPSRALRQRQPGTSACPELLSPFSPPPIFDARASEPTNPAPEQKQQNSALEAHRKPLYCVAFNHCDPRNQDLFASVGANRATVYRAKPDGAIEVVQTYADADVS